MRVLVTGASGFIGRHVTAALLAAGHEVVAAVRDTEGVRRRFPALTPCLVDMNVDTDPAVWLPRLEGCDAAVNCAGILREERGQSMEAIHFLAPRALFDACAAAGVRRVVQISAVSADREAPTDWARTKRMADDYLATLDLDWVVLRPSLVYAAGSYGGTSLLRGLAALPFVIPLVGRGEQAFQPIWIEDLARAVRVLAEESRPGRVVLSPVGPERMTLREILVRLRAWLDLPPALALAVPLPLVALLARLGDRLGRGPLNSTALRQLEYGNVAPPGPFAEAAGFSPRPMDVVLAAHPSHVQDRWHARLYFLKPLLRITLGLFWIASGALGLAAPVDVTSSVLAALGVPAALHLATWIAACALDVAIGGVVLSGIRPVAAGILQLAAIAAYTGALTLARPELWIDPFGPLLKNLPIAIAVLFLMAIEDER